MKEHRHPPRTDDRSKTLGTGPAPWNPHRIVGYIILVSAIVVGIVLAFNWRRLGKPEWQARTIVLSLLIPGLAVALALAWVFYFVPKPGMSIRFIVSVPFLALSANFGYAWALARLQNGGYKAYKARGWDALKKFEFDVEGAIIFGAGVTLLMWVIMIFLIPLLQR